ncbi:hypothetical protein IEQ34_009676 [Dendrobium chrysotoxum]|uniref:Uncharacterized protein n=1 Tax=Dendrobium chrysotoxum TaxID=161865 RepID=A0AAV7GZE8_DENCH|nr:hypothetical protein IEQ34_009676 [Dendrobium chrysotoxum]
MRDLSSNDISPEIERHFARNLPETEFYRRISIVTGRFCQSVMGDFPVVCDDSQQRKGTPFLTASMVEFQPQCDMKQAIAGCSRIFCCGDQPTILPRSATLSLNPKG